MNQRETIIKAWLSYKAAHPYSPHLAKAQAFFDYINARPDICWDDLVTDFRRDYYDAFDEVVGTLIETNDPLIIFNASQFADFNNPKEIEAARHAIQQLDADKHQASLIALAQVPALLPALKIRGYLPDSVRMALGYKPVATVEPSKVRRNRKKKDPLKDRVRPH